VGILPTPDLPDEDLLDERSGLAGLQFIERIGVEKKIPTDRYSFEKQETDVRRGDKLCARGDSFGHVDAIDLATRTVDIKKTKKTAEIHPAAASSTAGDLATTPWRGSLPTRNLGENQCLGCTGSVPCRP